MCRTLDRGRKEKVAKLCSMQEGGRRFCFFIGNG